VLLIYVQLADKVTDAGWGAAGGALVILTMAMSPVGLILFGIGLLFGYGMREERLAKQSQAHAAQIQNDTGGSGS
jgi:hypothetical protein